MQATRLQTLRGLTKLSRFHLFTAAAMYFGAPAWMGMLVAVGWNLASDETGIDAAVGTAMFFGMLMVALAPKLVGLAHLALTSGGVARFGGARALAISAGTEFVLSALMAPVTAFQVTVFLIGLAFGQRTAWAGQNRDVRRVGSGDAARGLWPQTLFGLALLGMAAVSGSWLALAWAAPVIAGLVLAVPFAIVTASPTLGRWAERAGICALPEEVTPAETLARLAAPEVPEPPLEPLKAA